MYQLTSVGHRIWGWSHFLDRDVMSGREKMRRPGDNAERLWRRVLTVNHNILSSSISGSQERMKTRHQGVHLKDKASPLAWSARENPAVTLIQLLSYQRNVPVDL
ncbi:hypothetical protein RRG08_054420 [Elysia crispata]|uniref:Uncharacterized protein n=1 Tax=Elysia crispata TaxID=231223 RepID=A0AAE1AWU0_9GAST|nr:hypothetical protein RRG08_054420 [Elysia crispata]